MANSTLTPTIITKRAMVEFKNAMVMLEKVDRQLDESFTGKVGDSVKVRKRVRYTAHNAADITSNINDTIEGSVTVTLDKRKVVAMQFDSKELGLDIEEFSDRYIRPAMVELAQQVESDIADQYKKIWNFTGTPGTNPSTFLQIGTVGAIMDEQGVPNGMGDRCAFYTPAAALTLADGLKGVFPQKIAENAIEYALVNNYAGFMVYKSQSLKNHTTGTYTTGSTPLVNGASQNVTYTTAKDGYTQSLITDGWAVSTLVLTEGDTFTIAGVNSVNPRTREDTGRLQSFVVRSAATSDGSGNATLTIAPAIITSGANQTVTAAPADNAAITPTSGTEATSYSQNLAFTKDAITVAFGKLAKPVGNVQYGQESLEGVNVRLVGDYDVLTDVNTWRFDVLYGVEAQNPGQACRHVGA